MRVQGVTRRATASSRDDATARRGEGPAGRRPAIPLATALSETWQYAALAAAAVALLLLRRGVVFTLLAAGTVGAVAGLLGASMPR